jgi:hypothetical protein
MSATHKSLDQWEKAIDSSNYESIYIDVSVPLASDNTWQFHAMIAMRIWFVIQN